MEVSWSRFFKSLAVAAGLILFLKSSASAGELYKPFRLFLGEPVDIHHRKKPHTGKDHAMEQLADEIDWLEAHIDAWGTVVAKQPDIWGEARMTKHRDEYERIMQKELDQFKLRLNASIRQSDQAYLANAFALTAAASDGTPPSVPEFAGAGVIAGSFTPGPQPFAGLDDDGIGLEPTIHLNQLSRYLEHLKELRRINEGDDTSDSPGYALNLVRIPVSVLPGKKTREGFGAEITITATSYLSDALMGDAMRNLTCNDLIDQLALPLLRATELDLTKQLKDADEQLKDADEQLKDADETLKARPASQEQIRKLYNKLQELKGVKPDPEAIPDATQLRQELVRQKARSYSEHSKRTAELKNKVSAPNVGGARGRRSRVPLAASQMLDVLGIRSLAEIQRHFSMAYLGRDVRWAGGGEGEDQRVHLPDVELYLHRELDAAYELLSSPHYVSLLKETIQSPGVKGHDLYREITESQWSDLRIRRRSFYTSLRMHSSSLLPPDAFDPVQAHHSEHQFLKPIAPRRPEGMEVLIPVAPSIEVPDPEIELLTGASISEVLAWSIVVELALLNDHLHEDMIRTSQAKGCGCAPARMLPCYLPLSCLEQESPFHEEYLEASQAFQEYVRCRWPIHVFALDPMEQDQNVGDYGYRRREMQLALALGFLNGRVSANNLSQYARRLETEVQTVTLNHTIIGFSHGDDTFGWRFTPRVQTPEVPGQLKAIGQTLLGGPSRDHDMAKWKLEPGIRECVAVVLMPSFVPYCDFDVRSNWFKLCNPKNTETSMRDNLKLSRSIKAMQDSAAMCAECQHLYRDGEVGRLLKRVHQLEQELPLQSTRIQVPFENTLGGFEMFNTGVTDLAPELKGWYGAPGVLIGGTACSVGAGGACTCVKDGDNCKAAADPLPPCPGEGTTLFLVGDNLSVHETRIIAGGVCIPHTHLVSRQIIQVTIPNCVKTVTIEGKQYVDIHAATPYGVTGHLHVPVELAPVTDDQVAKLKETITAELGQPQLKLADPKPITLEVQVKPNNETVTIELNKTSEKKPITIVLDDPYTAFSQLAGQPDQITILVAVGDPTKKELIGDPVTLTLAPRALKDDKLEFTSDEVAKALLDALSKASQQTLLTKPNDELEFDLVVYQVLNGTHFPKQVGGTGKFKLRRFRTGVIHHLPAP
jgi:hypothetical protein